MDVRPYRCTDLHMYGVTDIRTSYIRTNRGLYSYRKLLNLTGFCPFPGPLPKNSGGGGVEEGRGRRGGVEEKNK